MIGDDTLFKDKLTSILLASPNTQPEVKVAYQAIERKENYFKVEQSSIPQDRFTIDVFYLEDVINEAEPRANEVVNLIKKNYPDYKVRKRLLPRSINAKSGYRISGNEIRFEPQEKDIATGILELIIKNKIFQLEQPKSHLINHHSEKYISVFVRNM